MSQANEGFPCAADRKETDTAGVQPSGTDAVRMIGVRAVRARHLRSGRPRRSHAPKNDMGAVRHGNEDAAAESRNSYASGCNAGAETQVVTPI